MKAEIKTKAKSNEKESVIKMAPLRGHLFTMLFWQKMHQFARSYKYIYTSYIYVWRFKRVYVKVFAF